MGRVARVAPETILVEPSPANEIAPLKAGDGVVFDAADWRSPEEPEEGGRVYQVAAREGKLEVQFANRALNTARIRPGDLVWRTHDPDLDKAVRPFTSAVSPLRRLPVEVRLVAHEGEPLAAEWRLAGRPVPPVTVTSAAPLGAAKDRPLDAGLVTEQFGRLGNTPYELAGLEIEVQGRPFAPASMLNDLRRRAVEGLLERAGAAPPVTVCDPQAALSTALAAIAAATAAETPVPRIHLLVRTPEQLDAAVDLRPASITLDYLDLYGLRPSVERVKAAGIEARVASPRVIKPGEERIEDFLLRLDCPVLVRSCGLLEAFQTRRPPQMIGDFSLNAANAIAADLLLERGLARITPGYDLNAEQVATLASQAGAHRIEAVVYQHLPVFHTEHCVFCRFLSQGTSYRDCGRPCEKHRVALRDVSGRSHPVMADVGCRNTVFGAEAQEASLHLDAWRSAGIHHFRLEFVHESAAETTRVTGAFEQALSGKCSTRQLAADLRRTAPQGTTEGSFFVPANYLTLPVLQ